MDLNNQSDRNIQEFHFLFLDAIRGLACLLVMMGHFSQLNPPVFKLSEQFISSYALPSFFVLSSFLLTYKLILFLSQINLFDLKKIGYIILKYSVRRFFRIYLVFVIFVILMYFLEKLSSKYR